MSGAGGPAGSGTRWDTDKRTCQCYPGCARRGVDKGCGGGLDPSLTVGARCGRGWWIGGGRRGCWCCALGRGSGGVGICGTLGLATGTRRYNWGGG